LIALHDFRAGLFCFGGGGSLRNFASLAHDSPDYRGGFGWPLWIE